MFILLMYVFVLFIHVCVWFLVEIMSCLYACVYGFIFSSLLLYSARCPKCSYVWLNYMAYLPPASIGPMFRNQNLLVSSPLPSPASPMTPSSSLPSLLPLALVFASLESYQFCYVVVRFVCCIVQVLIIMLFVGHARKSTRIQTVARTREAHAVRVRRWRA